MNENKHINLLWTGGWDSTFRLITVLLIKKKSVQPYYLIDTDRKSTNQELRTMREIKNRLFNKYPEVKNLLLPCIYKEVHEIKPNEFITASFNRLLQDYHWGTQYEWLARFTEDTGIQNLELCSQKSEGEVRDHYFLNYLIINRDGNDEYYKVDSKFDGTDIYNVFKNFNFPVLNLTKADMEVISKKEGFNELLEITWFCHNPRSNGKPCGNCVPCIQLIKQGFGRRIPLRNRIRYYLSINRRIRNGFQKHPFLYNILKNIQRKNMSLNKTS